MRPEVVVFDVNETLSDMEPMRATFAAIGAPPDLLDTWFASTLRDGFALTAAGATASFPDVAGDVLRTLLHGRSGLTTDVDDAISQVLGGMSALDVHPDVPEGMRILHAAGVRLVTLTNGSAAIAAKLFDKVGVADLVERRMSVDEPGRWKPAPEAYRYAGGQCGVAMEAMAMVAVHPWDLDGAKRTGMLTGFVNRLGRPYPSVFSPPDVTGADLPAVATGLLAL